MTKLQGAVGFCRRAGKITIGVHEVVEKVRMGKIAVVLVSSDTMKNSFEKVKRICEAKNLPVYRVDLTKREMSDAIGLKRETGVLGIPKEFEQIVINSL